MRTASATPIFLLAACARLTGEPAPQPRSVTPAGAYRGEPAVVRIQGTGFSVRGVQHLGGEGRVESNFTVRIGGRALPAALVTDGTGEQELEVTVPADLPPGLHDVEVVDPYGTSAVLHGGFVESVGPPPSLSVRVDGPARSETGAPVDVVVTVDNGGGETATAVAVSFEAQTLAGGASVRPGDRLSLNVALPDPGLGPHEFVVAVSGTDGVTGLPLEAVTALARVDFVSPPTLRAVTYPPPAAVDVSQPFELRVDLTNDGDVDALAVQVVLDPDAALTAISPEPQDVPAGTTRTFILGARGTLPGIAAPRARALGSDALTSNPMPPLEALWPGIRSGFGRAGVRGRGAGRERRRCRGTRRPGPERSRCERRDRFRAAAAAGRGTCRRILPLAPARGRRRNWHAGRFAVRRRREQRLGSGRDSAGAASRPGAGIALR